MRWNDRDKARWERLQRLGAKAVVQTPEGEARMSAVILKVAEPLLEKYGTTPQRMNALISLAIAGWNRSVFPPEKREAVEKDLIEHFVPENADADTADVAIEVMDFVERKREQLFPDLRKIVVDFETEIVGDSLSLNVSSAAI